MPRTLGVRRREPALLAVASGVAALAVSLGLAGCSRGSAGGVGTSPLVPTPTTVPVPDDLRLVIFDRLPATLVEEPVGFDVEGPLDLAGAAKADASSQDSAAEQKYLRRFDFQRGYERAWKGKGQDRFLVNFVLQFGSPKEALAYFNGKTFADQTSADFTEFPVPPDFTNALGFTSSYKSANGAARVAQFLDLARGPFFYHLSLSGPSGAVAPGDILGIARSQSAEDASLGFS